MRISTEELFFKCRRKILSDLSSEAMDDAVKDAIITADAEINELEGKEPLAWNRETYDELFTKYSAEISDVTQADPGVITCDSLDPDLSDDHGFASTDLGFIRGIDGTERLNDRVFRLSKLTDTTLKLLTMDGDDEINTTNYDEYSASGAIYHVGFILPKASIQPTNQAWTIRNVWGMEIDGNPVWPISETEVLNESKRWGQPGGRPTRFRYQKYTYGSFDSGSDENSEHLLFLYNYPSKRYVCKIYIEKQYPHISTWDTVTYSHHPPEIHNYIWQMALADLAIESQKAKRKSVGRGEAVGDNTRMEVLNANYYIAKKAVYEDKIIEHSRKLAGYNRSTRGISA